MKWLVLLFAAACSRELRPATVSAPATNPLANLQLHVTRLNTEGTDKGWGGPPATDELYFDNALLFQARKTNDARFPQLEQGRLGVVADASGSAIAYTIDGGQSYRYAVVQLVDGHVTKVAACQHVAMKTADELFKRWPDRAAFEKEIEEHPEQHQPPEERAALDSMKALGQP